MTRSFGRFCSALTIRRLPLPRQILEAVGVKQRLVELAALVVAHLRERRVGDDLSDVAAQCGGRHRREPSPPAARDVGQKLGRF